MPTIEKSSPSSLGIPENAIISFLSRLQKEQIAMHSVHFLYKDALILDHYYAPFQGGQLHRMFSISKSYTAVAIMLLEEEGKLSIEDSILQYFPEYDHEVHPWIATMTIRDMLMMRTCHKSTTYKIDPSKNWVESFFVTKPTHPAGAFFHYDTGSAHVLCALVEKLTGMLLLDYLRHKLAPLGLSKDAYMLQDPFGVSMGGSGLVAPASDLLRFGYFLLHEGNVDGKQLLSAEHIRMLTARWSDTSRNATVLGEAQGYGMMFWRMANDGYMCFGMGGQFILCYPKYQFCCCTTADTQFYRGGNQFIFDALEEEILPYLKEELSPRRAVSDSKEQPSSSEFTYEEFLANLTMQPLGLVLPSSGDEVSSGLGAAHALPFLGCKRYLLDANPQGFADFALTFETDCGKIAFTLSGKPWELFFGFGKLVEGSLPEYGFRYYGSALQTDAGQIYIRLEVVDSHVGSIHLELHLEEKSIAIAMKKVEEDFFQEFQGILIGSVCEP